ncbi:MAG: EFR1 family ferrodoxin [Candidatus Heimdallarchaeota archaeon]
MSITIGLVYFSATGNTRTIATIMKNELEAKEVIVKKFDITSFTDRDKVIPFSELNYIIFGFPIYGRKIPSVTKKWLETISGKKQRCGMFFTYGGPMRGDIHNETKSLLEARNFVVIASAEMLGKHSFNIVKGWELLKDHPNVDDLNIAKEYTQKLLEKFTRANIESIDFPVAEDNLLPRDPNRKSIRLITQHPSRNDKDCCMCRDCILCMRCLAICPDQVIEINDMTEGFQDFVERLGLTPELLASRKSQYFI